MVKTPTRSDKEHFIAILCGGTGPRLWPLSRASKPKQFLKLLNDDTLLNETISRATKIVDPSHVFIITNKKYSKQISEGIDKRIPKTNIILEPSKKNTLMAVLYGCYLIDKKYPDSIVTFLPSDHYIKKQNIFIKQIKDSYKLALKKDSMVILGITPKYANPSYGYVQTNLKQGDFYSVSKFIEKPNKDYIQKLSKNKNIFWNAGIYTIPTKLFFNEVAKYQKQYSLNLLIQNPAIAYSKYPNLSIDVGISQKTDKLLLIEANFIWSDIGEWKTIHEYNRKNSNKISKLNQDTQYLSIDSNNCLISGYSDKLIGLIGINDVAIIDTPDGLLICKLDQSLLVRDLVGKITSKKAIDKYFLKSSEPNQKS